MYYFQNSETKFQGFVRAIFTLMALLYLNSFEVKANFVEIEQVNLTNAPLDSVQKTIWQGFPVIIHRRTETQIKNIKELFQKTPSYESRIEGYRSIARTNGHDVASNIMEFTEKYISSKNLYMSEVPEYGIYSMVSPILGCSIEKVENGFVDPCHGVEFDITGKVINHKGFEHHRLTIPPHRIENNRLIFLKEYKAKKLVDFTPDILSINDSVLSKAFLAVDFERLDLLKVLISENPKVLSEKNEVGSSLLHLSAYHQTTLDYLLTFKELSINEVNDSGYTPLLFAIHSENFENAIKLVERGARFDSFVSKGVVVKSVYEFVGDNPHLNMHEIEKLIKQFDQISKK